MFSVLKGDHLPVPHPPSGRRLSPLSCGFLGAVRTFRTGAFSFVPLGCGLRVEVLQFQKMCASLLMPLTHLTRSLPKATLPAARWKAASPPGSGYRARFLLPWNRALFLSCVTSDYEANVARTHGWIASFSSSRQDCRQQDGFGCGISRRAFVRFWHLADINAVSENVRFRG